MEKGLSKEELMNLDEEELREKLDEMVKNNKEQHDMAVKMGMLGMDINMYQRYVNIVEDIREQVEGGRR